MAIKRKNRQNFAYLLPSLSFRLYFVVLGVLLLLLITVASGEEESADNNPRLISSNYELMENGDYNYGYRLSNGNAIKVVGKLKEVRNENNEPVKIYEVTGYYSFEAPEGKIYRVTFKADEGGYKIVSFMVKDKPTRVQFNPKSIPGILG